MRSGVRSGVATLALFALVTVRAEAQCEGDCNRDGQVAINELILAVTIVLGSGTVGDCIAADRDGNGTIAIDELVFAVSRSLLGCEGMVNEDALRASSSATVDPIIRIYDLGGAAAGSFPGAGLAALAALGSPAGFSGCQVFDCIRDGVVTGTEEICCLGNEYSRTTESCQSDDPVTGDVVSRVGKFVLRGDNVGCSGQIPVGVDFDLEFGAPTPGGAPVFFLSVLKPDGTLVYSLFDFTESFEPVPGGCAETQPDQFGLGIHGNGTRHINGVQHQATLDSSGQVLREARLEADNLRILVASLLDEDGTCSVGAELRGTLTSTDFRTSARFTTTYSDYQLIQVPVEGALFFFFGGTYTADCLGEVMVATPELLRLGLNDDCLTGGRLQARVGDATTLVTYTPSGGLEFDFGGDGSIDERLDSCQDLVLEQCVGEEIAGLCAECIDASDCTGDLVCLPCADACSGNVDRCTFANDFATCEDGVF
jgi:hypothetical protein